MKTLLSVLLWLVCINLNATTYYVSNAGTSANNGTSSSSPWNLAKLNASFSTLQPGDLVLFNRGETFFGSINPAKSGASGSPITFDAYGTGADPIISGFSTVSAWTSVGTNLWMSTSAVTSNSSINMVTVNGAFTPIGKFPDGQNVYDTVTAATTGTSLTGKKLTASSSLIGATVAIRKNHWIIDKSTITAHSGSTLTFTNPTGYPITVGYGYIVQNHQSVCNLQNEWWFDATTKKLGLYSTTAPTGVQVSSVDVLVNANTYSYLTFKHLQLIGSNSNAFTMSSAHHIVIDGCTFLYNGMNGITAQPAVNNITFQNNNVDYTNNDFINGGSSTNWTIINNTIRRTAQNAGMGNSADGQYIALYNIGNNSLIQYNTIKSSGYSGIDFRGSGITVANNLVDSFCNVKDDGAGIYTWTGATTTVYAQRFVRNNIVLNGGGGFRGTTTTNSDAFGIYMDDNSSQVTATGNTIANCGSSGIFFHAAHAVTFSDNTVYNCVTASPYGQLLQIYPGATATDPVRNITFKKNKIISKTASQFVAYLQTNEASMSNWGAWDSNYYCRPRNDATATNTLRVNTSSGSSTTNLQGWINSSTLDLNSKKSPVNIANESTDLRFEYNATNTPVTISLSGFNYKDVTGVNYPGTITLQPWTSAVLIKQGAANSLPTVNAGADQVVSQPPTTSVTLSGTASVVGGTITSYQWTKVSGSSATITSPASATTTVTGLAVGVHTFELKVTDDKAGVSKDTMRVTVNPPGQLPTVNAGPDIFDTLTHIITLRGSASDSDGTIVSYTWSMVSGMTAVTFGSATQPTTTLGNLGKGTYLFQLTVKDNSGGTASDTVQVIMVEQASPPVARPPAANAGADIKVTIPVNGTTATITLSGSGVAGDYPIASYKWTKIDPFAPGTITNPNAATTTVTGLPRGTYTFTLTVTDTFGQTDTDNITITVTKRSGK